MMVSTGPAAGRDGRGTSCPAVDPAPVRHARGPRLDPEATAPIADAARASATPHFPFSFPFPFPCFEVNPRFDFDRAAAHGTRPAVAAGSSTRFESGATAEVGLVPVGGVRIAIGLAGPVGGSRVVPGAKALALARAAACGHLGVTVGHEGGGRA
ncbi:urease subunit beta [Streptomyces sp. NPDC091682]|uniref:urease subunit beta n=1 Tax=Streptomyces sp. NPDC091682 TaxID=3366005 RepID=UPI0038229138